MFKFLAFFLKQDVESGIVVTRAGEGGRGSEGKEGLVSEFNDC